MGSKVKLPMIRNMSLPQHCRTQKCANQSKAVRVHLNPRIVVRRLREMKAYDDSILDALKTSNITYHKLVYRKLLLGQESLVSTERQWSELLRFLGHPRKRKIPEVLWQRSFRSVVTTPLHHKDVLKNYSSIADVIRASEFKDLLH